MRIDPHVHLRDEEQSYKETIAHGLALANEQGADYVFDMPNTLKPILTRKDVVRRLKIISQRDKKRYFLYIGATSSQKQLREAAKLVGSERVVGIKMFAGRSIGNLAITGGKKQKKIYEILAKEKYTGVLAVHCEKEAYVKNIFNPDKPYSHALSRPKKAEIESIKDQIRFARESGFQGILHICHVSCPESVKMIGRARKEIRITCGVTPHHLIWDDSMLRNACGLLYKTNPPLRSKGSVNGLRECLKEGKIDWIETDHAPHAVGEKLHGGYPSGYPSLYLYKYCVDEFLPEIGLTREQIEDLTFNNIIKTFEYAIGGKRKIG